jgi:predicted transcriptional regulator
MDVRISDAELDVMEALWAASQPLTASGSCRTDRPTRGWSLATVKTMLSRLAAKGALTHADGRRFLYSPAIGAKLVWAMNRRFVERLFGGRLSPLVAQFAEEDALDEDDIAAIEAMLKELVVTDWLLGTLLATSALLVAVLLIRGPSVVTWRPRGLWIG